MTSLLSAGVIVLGPLLGAYHSFKTIKARSTLLRQAATAATANSSSSSSSSSSFFQSSRRAPPTVVIAAAPDPELVAAVELNRKETLDMLMYWVAFAVLIVFTRFIEPLVFWVPFYEYGKLGDAVFIAVPDTKGARFAFETALAPVVDAYESAFMEKVWPKLQRQMLDVAQWCELTVLGNGVDEVSGQELEKCERDMQMLLLKCKKERSKRRAAEESRGDGI